MILTDAINLLVLEEETVSSSKILTFKRVDSYMPLRTVDDVIVRLAVENPVIDWRIPQPNVYETRTTSYYTDRVAELENRIEQLETALKRRGDNVS